MTVLRERAIGTPGLTSLKGQLLLAWTDTDANHSLNFVTSQGIGAGGPVFTPKSTLNERSIAGPALANSDRNTAWIAWTGTDGAGHLNVARTDDGLRIVDKVTLQELSAAAPALAFGEGTGFLAWTGVDGAGHLNVMVSPGGGTAWTDKMTLPETSVTSPALCFAFGRLFLVWCGTDDHQSLNVMSAIPGRPLNFTGKVTLAEQSLRPPAICVAQQDPLGTGPLGLVLAWTGMDSASSLNTITSDSGAIWKQKITYTDSASDGVQVTDFLDTPFIAWTGADAARSVNANDLLQMPTVG